MNEDMPTFQFTNLESKVRIPVTTDKDITYIYGGNGTGKTTFSREFITTNKNSKVFNVDFINKNVYVIDSDGPKTDVSNKDNFTSLFVSEKAVNLAETMIAIKDLNKQIETLKTEKQQNINKRFSLYKINSIELNDIFKKIDFSDSKFDFTKKTDDNIKLLSSKSTLATSIKNEDELLARVKQYLSNEQIKKINDLLNQNSLLKSIFIDKDYIVNLNVSIKLYNNTLEHIIIQETKFKELGNTEKIKAWIFEGLKLHHDKQNCIFCGAENISSSIEEWNTIVQSKVLEQKQQLKNKIENSIKDLDRNVISKKDTYAELVPKIYHGSEKLVEILMSIQKSLEDSSTIKDIELEILVDDIALKAEEIYSEISNYIVNEKFIDYMFPYAYSKFLSLKQIEYEKNANDVSKLFADNTKGIIQTIATKLGLEKELSVLTETRKGSVPRLSINPAETGLKIGNFSEGQRHKLALAVFFAELIMSKVKPEYLVLDDPTLSLDVVTYHKLKTYIILELKDKFEKIIILTHNIGFLLIMLSNVFRSSDLKNKTKLIELKPTKSEAVSLDTIAKDDIILFIDAIKNSVTIDDVSLWYWLIDKIARYFVDIKLSLKGIISFEDVQEDIKNAFDDNKIARAKELNKIITSTSKNKNSNIGDIYNALKSLNEYVQLLGFPVIIESNLIDAFVSKFKKEDKVVSNPSPKNLEYSVLKEGFNLAFDTSSENAFLKDYIMHPRHQITESLVAFEAQKDK